MSLDLIKKIIEEEIRNVLDYKTPSDVEVVKDAWAGGPDLEDPVEHIPEDVPADVETPQAKIGIIKDMKSENVVKIDAAQIKSIIDECMGNDYVTDTTVSDEQISDHEGRMAKSQLYQTAKNAHAIYQMIDESSELPAWVQGKLTKAADYIQAVYSHLDHEESGEPETVIAGSIDQNED